MSFVKLPMAIYDRFFNSFFNSVYKYIVKATKNSKKFSYY